MAKYRIMTFDGGGVRGVVAATLLNRLNRALEGFYHKTDLVAGTSVGASLALGVALGLPPKTLMLLFSPPSLTLLLLPYPTLARRRRGKTVPLYASFYDVLAKFFPIDIPLKSIEKRVLIPAFQLEDKDTGNWQPVFFNNFPDSQTADASAIDVAMRSAAAPIYWPTYQRYIDGWTVANNPSTAALAAAIDARQGRQQLGDVSILSFGIGRCPQKVRGRNLHWGSRQWLSKETSVMVRPPLLDILFYNSSVVNSGYCAQMLGEDRFLRVDVDLDEVVAIDDARAVRYLKSRAKEVDIEPYVRWIKANWL